MTTENGIKPSASNVLANAIRANGYNQQVTNVPNHVTAVNNAFAEEMYEAFGYENAVAANSGNPNVRMPSAFDTYIEPNTLPEVQWDPSATGEAPDDYQWLVTTATIAGTIGGVLLTKGMWGATIGGAALGAAAVPLRRYLAASEDPNFEKRNPGIAMEMGTTFGVNFALGAAFGGLGKGVSWGGNVMRGVFARKAAGAVAKNGLWSLVRNGIGATYSNTAARLALRGTAGCVAIYDMLHDADGNFNPEGFMRAKDENGETHFKLNALQLDTWWGFVAAIYSGNAVFSRTFGANLRGLDTAAPFSIASYKAFRWLGGEDLTDFEDFNYNEALYWRYIAEMGNVLMNTGVYGRAYLRPDMRQTIAREKYGLTASKETGTLKASPFGLAVDHTLGRGYRAAAQYIPGFKNVVRPLVSYPTGKSLIPYSGKNKVMQNLSDRMVVVKGFKNNDMMKPEYGVAGRIANIGYEWALRVPWWMVTSGQVGMSPSEWGANRWIKMTAMPLWGNPIKYGLGGDTPWAQAGGFGVGLGIDAIATLFANGRFKKKHWSKDFRRSLNEFNASRTDKERNEIADHILDDIFDSQMTDFSYTRTRMFENYYEFNPDYVDTFQSELSELNKDEMAALEKVFENRMDAFRAGKLSRKEAEGLAHIEKALAWSKKNK